MSIDQLQKYFRHYTTPTNLLTPKVHIEEAWKHFENMILSHSMSHLWTIIAAIQCSTGFLLQGEGHFQSKGGGNFRALLIFANKL